jgi:hypothetical protein
MQSLLPRVEYEGVHCGLVIERPAAGVALITLRGVDAGEFGDFPMRELAKDLAQFPLLDLFIDARAVRGASVNVSAEWALWMRTHRKRFNQICMLTGSRYIQVTAEFVRRFSETMDRMRLCTDVAFFEQSLETAVALRGVVGADVRAF